MTFRVVVDRVGTGLERRPRVDALDCHAWGGRVQKQSERWRLGDVVDLHGALRRRFYRAVGGQTLSVTEVEVVRGRLVRRAAA